MAASEAGERAAEPGRPTLKVVTPVPLKLRAVYRYARQIGPEDWQMQPCVLDVTRATTVGEIIDWYQQQSPRDVQPYIAIVGEEAQDAD